MEESFFWQPSERITFLPWETLDEPLYARGPAHVLPRPWFGFRAMTEVEVQAFARGVATMATNAWIASVKAYDTKDTDLEVF